MSHRRPLLAALVVLVLLGPRLGATWSIVVVDRATGEVGVGTATCLPGLDLRRWVPVVAVGHGAGVTQAKVAAGPVYKQIIFNGLHDGLTPAEIITALTANDGPQCVRQYGVVDLSLGSASFTGSCTWKSTGHRNGSLGTIAWAIQGNVITGQEVLVQAEAALLSTPGMLSDKLMAAMEAARAMGGDGRCSCLTGSAPSCGAPPAGGFEKSAHCGTVIVARIGDTDGPCLGHQSGGCAQGDYWLALNFKGLESDPDPVFVLAAQYDDFKRSLLRYPDALRSAATWRAPTVLPVGTLLELELQLADLEGVPVPTGGAHITLGHGPGSAGLAQRYVVEDHGGGRYTLRILAQAAAGKDIFTVVVDDRARPVTLYPYPEIEYPALLVSQPPTGGMQGVAEPGPVLHLLTHGQPLAPDSLPGSSPPPR